MGNSSSSLCQQAEQERDIRNDDFEIVHASEATKPSDQAPEVENNAEIHHENQQEAENINNTQAEEQHGDENGHENEEEPSENNTRTIELHTAPMDPRFSSSNASRYCYTAYNEYYKCIKEKGEDAPECKFYARTYRSICPMEWIAHWNELREEGTWFGKY